MGVSEQKFLEERAALEAKYDKLYAPLYDQRSSIVTGKVEPEEVPEEEQEDAERDDEAAEEKEEEAENEDIEGVPEFWCGALKNNEVLEEVITEKVRSSRLHMGLIEY